MPETRLPGSRTPAPSIPRPGQFATVRNRRGVISAVVPHDGPEGRLHLVHLDYKDDGLPVEERVLWELEPGARLLEPTALPPFASTSPMPARDFDALLRAARWTALSPYVDPGGEGPVARLPISSPFHGAVQVEDYQLVPLLKALRMPRVNLMLADDVGLGKTIEAGLILSELLLRRRIQRVLILTPASLRLQWRDEMWEKFSLRFDLVDRMETYKLRKRLGLDANPWRSFPRIIASYHYLRQDDVLEQFLSASASQEDSPHLPWDLLIVDECHNLMPSAFGDDSDLCRMLRLVAPRFEHRLFLSATPHNGHTRCFTGLLEILDPVRFSQTSELNSAGRNRVQQVVLRRLKREINARSHPAKFAERNPPQSILLRMDPAEARLGRAFDSFRRAVKGLIQRGDRRRRRSGSFAIEILNKRLLSSPTAFAESWRRSKEGLAEAEAASDAEVAAAARAALQDTGDDREAQRRDETAAGVVGAWLQAVAGELRDEIAAIDEAIESLGLDLAGGDLTQQDPAHDARFDAIVDLIETSLRGGDGAPRGKDRSGAWRDDERLVVFTEYKTTLDYLERRLRERYEPDRILLLFGGMDEVERGLVKDAFNDPSAQVRILLATDAAAEGLNLQRTARILLHYDCPWNPSRLEQRNGRLDRHGQARDVTVHHFLSDQDQDLKFLAHVIAKAHDIREDLSSANELFDEAAHRRLVDGDDLETVRRDLDRRIETARGRSAINADETVETSDKSEGADFVSRASAAEGTPAAPRELEAIAAEIDLDGGALRDTLEAAMGIRAALPQLEACGEAGTYKLVNPGLPGWAEVVDDSLRRATSKDALGPVARLAFGPEPFLEDCGGRLVFAPRPDVLWIHLAHPMLQKALGSLTRCRFPGSGEAVSRWTVRLAPPGVFGAAGAGGASPEQGASGGWPAGAGALVLLSVEELAVNDLRESFHHWVRTVVFPVRDGKLGEPLPHRTALSLRGAAPVTQEEQVRRGQDILEEVEPDLKRFLGNHAGRLTESLRAQLERTGKTARVQEDERYRSRQAEISSLIAENTLDKLEREVKELEQERSQGHLYDEAERLERIERSIEEKSQEIARRSRHIEEVREQLKEERKRILKHLLPRRHRMSGEAQVFPVTVEVWLPVGASPRGGAS